MDLEPSMVAFESGSVSSEICSSFTILSSAGRLASGKSVGAEGEEGSSNGLFVEAIAVVDEGDADMSRDLGKGVDTCKCRWISKLIYYGSRVLCTPGDNPKEKVLVQREFRRDQVRGRTVKVGGLEEVWRVRAQGRERGVDDWMYVLCGGRRDAGKDG